MIGTIGVQVRPVSKPHAQPADEVLNVALQDAIAHHTFFFQDIEGRQTASRDRGKAALNAKPHRGVAQELDQLVITGDMTHRSPGSSC